MFKLIAVYTTWQFSSEFNISSLSPDNTEDAELTSWGSHTI